MNNFLKVSLLAAAVAVGLTACQKDEKPAATNTAEVKAEASKPAEAPKAEAKSFEEQSGRNTVATTIKTRKSKVLSMAPFYHTKRLLRFK
jgi:cytochrome c5